MKKPEGSKTSGTAPDNDRDDPVQSVIRTRPTSADVARAAGV